MGRVTEGRLLMEELLNLEDSLSLIPSSFPSTLCFSPEEGISSTRRHLFSHPGWAPTGQGGPGYLLLQSCLQSGHPFSWLSRSEVLREVCSWSPASSGTKETLGGHILFACCFIPAEEAPSQMGLWLSLLRQFDPWDTSVSGQVGVPMVVSWEGHPGASGPRGFLLEEQQRLTSAKCAAALREGEEWPNQEQAGCLQKALSGKHEPRHSGTRGRTLVVKPFTGSRRNGEPKEYLLV